jgi:aspartyl-tRNA(Asn)/glutamyl-tRNA(Gln) amidotransferase subunit A
MDARDWHEAIGSGDRELHAFLEIAGTEAAGRSGILGGVPIAIKDNIATTGTRTTCASRMLEEYRSPFDATAVSRLRAVGAAIAGKTNLDEFAMGSSTEHSAFGVTKNPWDLTRVPGGSSGGSAAAVAAGLVPVALGSETGGSVRQPAAFCGVLGLKPTYGRVSRYGLVAFASSLDQIGIFARTASDAGRVLEVIAGHDPFDATSSRADVDRYSDHDTSVAAGRFGVIAEAVEQLDDDARTNFESAVQLLRSAGANVETVSVSAIRDAIAIYYVVANAEASANLARFDGVRYGRRAVSAGTLQELYERSRGEGFGTEVKRRIMLGTFVLSAGHQDAYYGRAQRARSALRAVFDEAFARFEFLLTPTTPTAAFRIGEKVADPLSMYLSDIFTAPANLTGHPAIAIPSGFSREGLPRSLQVMGRPFAERNLLSVASLFERETEYHRSVPGAAR